MITWDEPKRRANLKKHRIDLAELESVFDGPMITVEDAREAYGEAQLQSLGFCAAASSFWSGPRASTTQRISSPAAMPIAKKRTITSAPSSEAEVAAAKTAAWAKSSRGTMIDWSSGAVTRGGGVAATVEALRRVRGPGKKPAKEQVALRLDPEVLVAFRTGGPGWQTRMNAALKEWLSDQARSKSQARISAPGIKGPLTTGRSPGTHGLPSTLHKERKPQRRTTIDRDHQGRATALERLPLAKQAQAVGKLCDLHTPADAGQELGKPRGWITKMQSIAKAVNSQSVAGALVSQGRVLDIEMAYDISRIEKKSPQKARDIAGNIDNETRQTVKQALEELPRSQQTRQRGHR